MRTFIVAASLVLCAIALEAAVNPASLQFIDGKSTFTIGDRFIIGIHRISVDVPRARVTVDADWNAVQEIERDEAPSGRSRGVINATMFDAHGNPFQVILSGCVSESTAAQVQIDSPQQAPMPKGAVPLNLQPTPTPLPTMVELRCRRITAE